jgi:hypothetical protein
MATIDVDNHSSAVTFAPDGLFAYVTQAGINTDGEFTVSKIDTVSVIDTAGTGRRKPDARGQQLGAAVDLVVSSGRNGNGGGSGGGGAPSFERLALLSLLTACRMRSNAG